MEYGREAMHSSANAPGSIFLHKLYNRCIFKLCIYLLCKLFSSFIIHSFN